MFNKYHLMDLSDALGLDFEGVRGATPTVRFAPDRRIETPWLSLTVEPTVDALIDMDHKHTVILAHIIGNLRIIAAASGVAGRIDLFGLNDPKGAERELMVTFSPKPFASFIKTVAPACVFHYIRYSLDVAWETAESVNSLDLDR